MAEEDKNEVEQKVPKKINPMDLLDTIYKKERDIEKNQEKSDLKFNFTLIGLGSLIVLLIGLITFLFIYSDRRVAKTVIDMTRIKDGFKLSEAQSINERKEKFKKFMIRIIDSYGKTYRKKQKPHPKALSVKEKEKYIIKCWDWARLINVPEYWIPQIHKQESNFNPWCFNDWSNLDESGIGQQTFNTALSAMAIVKFLMPKRMKKELDFTIRKREDLFEWENSTKATFILIWYRLRQYNFREEWAVSCYKWNNWLGRFWDKGKGDIPYKFVINKKDYYPYRYYANFKSWVEAWESGDIEPGKVNDDYWESFQNKLMKDEISLRKARSIIRTLIKRLKERDDLVEKLKQKDKETDRVIKDAENKLKIIYGSASRQRYAKQIKKELRRAKGVTEKLIKKIWGKEDIPRYIFYLVYLFIITMILSIGGVITLFIRAKLKKRNKK